MSDHERSSKVAHLLAGGALVLAGYLMGGGQARPEAQAAGGVGIDNGWGIAVDSGGWVLAKGADGIAYKVTVDGWRSVGQEYQQGPLKLY